MAQSFGMGHFGIVNTNKPRGRTSRDAVNHVQRLCRPAKVGHAGTLDPLAEGVLVICVGQATRLVPYLQQMRKNYRATFLLDRHSDTDDVEGNVTLVLSGKQPERAAIEAALPKFLGDISQRPPAHSAVKLNGRRAYALARRGIEFELAPRIVTVHRLKVFRYEYPTLELDVECGSGTYVRSLGRDLAESLGTSAVMSALVRLAVGPFHFDDAVALSALTAESIGQDLQPALAAVAELPRVALGQRQLADIRHGRPVALTEVGDALHNRGCEGEWAAVDAGGQLVAILCEKRPGQLWPRMNLA